MGSWSNGAEFVSNCLQNSLNMLEMCFSGWVSECICFFLLGFPKKPKICLRFQGWFMRTLLLPGFLAQNLYVFSFPLQ